MFGRCKKENSDYCQTLSNTILMRNIHNREDYYSYVNCEQKNNEGTGNKAENGWESSNDEKDDGKKPNQRTVSAKQQQLYNQQIPAPPEEQHVHIGQLKLLLAEAQFLSLHKPTSHGRNQHTNKNKRAVTVLYVGAASGNHLRTLRSMFPWIDRWVLYDPGAWCGDVRRTFLELPTVGVLRMQWLQQHPAGCFRRTAPFTISEATRWSHAERQHGDVLLFISDVRTLQYNSTSSSLDYLNTVVITDQVEQAAWVYELCPDGYMVKHRPPYVSPRGRWNTDYLTLPGEVVLQAFSRQNSTEVRIIGTVHDLVYQPPSLCSPLVHQSAMAYFNRTERAQRGRRNSADHQHQHGILTLPFDILDTCYRLHGWNGQVLLQAVTNACAEPSQIILWARQLIHSYNLEDVVTRTTTTHDALQPQPQQAIALTKRKAPSCTSAPSSPKVHAVNAIKNSNQLLTKMANRCKKRKRDVKKLPSSLMTAKYSREARKEQQQQRPSKQRKKNGCLPCEVSTPLIAQARASGQEADVSEQAS